MHCYTFLNPSLEKIGQKELQELLKAKATARPLVLEFEVKNAQDQLDYLYHTQAARRIVIALGTYANHQDFDPATLNFPWSDFFPQEFSFRVEVENVKGQENRFEIAKTVAGKLFKVLEKKNLKPALELKKPDFLVIIFFNGKKYFVGLDLAGKELSSRHYRVFSHQATGKGDLSYQFLRFSGFKPKEKLLVGLAKDGSIAIEAALYANRLPVQNLQEELCWKKFPLFKDVDVASIASLIPKTKKPIKNLIFAFDTAQPNVIAARKNAAIAGAKEYLDLQKIFLEDLDVKFPERDFDRLIVQLTKKDEEKLNEVFYQANYVLKEKGTLFVISRTELELPTPSNYILKQQQEVQRGESKYKCWLLVKNEG